MWVLRSSERIFKEKKNSVKTTESHVNHKVKMMIEQHIYWYTYTLMFVTKRFKGGILYKAMERFIFVGSTGNFKQNE
jgi:hypothetical protein